MKVYVIKLSFGTRKVELYLFVIAEFDCIDFRLLMITLSMISLSGIHLSKIFDNGLLKFKTILGYDTYNGEENITFNKSLFV